MNKLERDTLESLAKRHNTSKRIPVVLPDLPKVGLLMEDREQAWNDDWDEWNRQVIADKPSMLGLS